MWGWQYLGKNHQPQAAGIAGPVSVERKMAHENTWLYPYPQPFLIEQREYTGNCWDSLSGNSVGLPQGRFPASHLTLGNPNLRDNRPKVTGLLAGDAGPNSGLRLPSTLCSVSSCTRAGFDPCTPDLPGCPPYHPSPNHPSGNQAAQLNETQGSVTEPNPERPSGWDEAHISPTEDVKTSPH